MKVRDIIQRLSHINNLDGTVTLIKYDPSESDTMLVYVKVRRMSEEERARQQWEDLYETVVISETTEIYPISPSNNVCRNKLTQSYKDAYNNAEREKEINEWGNI